MTRLTAARIGRYRWWLDMQPSTFLWRVSLRVRNDTMCDVIVPVDDAVEDDVFWPMHRVLTHQGRDENG